MKLRLISRKAETKDVESFIFEPEAPLSWQAGQFLHYNLIHQDSDDRGTERWFTISAAPYEGHVMLTTRFTNPGGSSFKQALANMKIGEEIEADTADGDFVYDKSAARCVLIAGGIGITPYRSMLVQLNHDKYPIKADLLYANRDRPLVFESELNEIARSQRYFKIKPYIGDELISREDLKGYLDQENVVFYISGPKKMVDVYQLMLEELGFNDTAIKLDYFPGYGTYPPQN